jgi:outer membrane protein assembly factor BamB
LWKQQLCTVKEDGSGPRYRHHLLTLAGQNLIYASHSGAVVAVDAVTGKHAWARRYRSRGPNLAPDRPSRRDLGACLYAAGHLYVAPLDDSQLLCLDPTTGSIVWAKREIEVEHILGVADGRLIITASVMPGNTVGESAETQIRALDAATGDKTIWAQPGDGRGIKPFGRGILFGKCILWPTMEGVCILQVEDGKSVYEPVIESIRRGNIAYADGCLVVADLYSLSLYVSEARQKGEREEKIKDDPDSPQALLRRGQDLVDHQDVTAATDSFLALLRKPDTMVENSPGIGVMAAAEARRCLCELSKEGRVAAALDQLARQDVAVLASVKDSQSRIKAIHRALEAYPGSPAVRALLPELAAMHEKNAEWGAAARVYRSYLQQASEPAPRADALARLALCYEKQHAWPAARSTWLQLAREAGDRTMPQVISKEDKVGAYVEQHLKQAEFQPADRTNGAFAITWHTQLSSWERMIVGQSLPYDRTPDEWFTARGKFVTCRETATGKVRWTKELPAAPEWCARCLDLAVLGGPRAVQCLSIADGEAVWKVACTDDRGRFSDFQLVGDRLYFLHGLDRLLAVNVATGKVVWIAQAPPGSQVLPEHQAGFFPRYLATEKHVVIYTELSGALILDAVDGTQVRRLTPAGALGTRGGPPTPLSFGNGEKVYLALDQDHIIGFDLGNLKERWRYKLPFAANRTGAWPILVKSNDGIVVGTPVNLGMIEQRLDPDTGKAVPEKGRLVSKEDLLRLDAVGIDPPPRQFGFRWLLLSVQCDIDAMSRDGTFNVVLRDEKTGKEVQRLAFHPEASHWPVSLQCNMAFSWRPQLEERPASNVAGPRASRYADGLIVTLGKDAWRVSPKSTP